jgi:thymidylate kinase
MAGLRDDSRVDYAAPEGKTTLETLRVGALLRIADALEPIAMDKKVLMRRLSMAEDARDRIEEEAKKRETALKAAATKRERAMAADATQREWALEDEIKSLRRKLGYQKGRVTRLTKKLNHV